MARMDLDGNLDSSFGGDGKVVSDVGREGHALAVSVEPNGSLFVTGQALNKPDVFTARYLVDGSRDRSYGSNGVIWYEEDEIPRYIKKLARNTDGSYLAVADEGVYRLVDGRPDPSFGLDGTAVVPDNVKRLLLFLDRFYVVGTENCRAVVYRHYVSNGRLDTSWGFGGRLYLDFSLGENGCSGGTALHITPLGLYVGGRRGTRQAIAYVDRTGEYMRECPEAPLPPQGPFRRGDANDDDSINVSDPAATLAFLFSGGTAPPCHKAADVNDNGSVEISDAAYLLNFLFSGGPPPAAPFPNCGN